MAMARMKPWLSAAFPTRAQRTRESGPPPVGIQLCKTGKAGAALIEMAGGEKSKVGPAS
jgi:hypothetical protein